MSFETALHAYTKSVQTAFATAEFSAKAKGGLIPFQNKTNQLRALVEQLERDGEFNQLLERTRSEFCGEFHKSKSESAWKHAVQSFFRRTGYYNFVFKGLNVPFDLARTYEAAFRRRQINITYLAPMEFVKFPKSKSIFSGFEIRQFDPNELETIAGNEINRIFYPHAVVDTQVLRGYWFIVIKVQHDAPRLGRIDVDLTSIGRVLPVYTTLPREVERVLNRLVLFDWVVEPDDDHYPYGSQFGFNIPFVVRVDDNELSYPRSAPDCSKLAMEPQIDPNTEEEYKTRTIFFELRDSDLIAFEQFIARADECLRNLEADKTRWPFLKVAMGNLIKGFFADGVEQLLWHITALESLLGERKQGIEASLKRRTAVILELNENQRAAVRKQFKNLYDLRCDLVHGNEFKQSMHWQNLFEARAMARQVMIWFVHYLAEIAVRINEGSWQGDIPKREDFLNLLDLSDADRSRFSSLLNNLPSGFPTAPTWSR